MAQFRTLQQNTKLELLKLGNIFEVIKDIKSIKIQGATNIAREAMKCLSKETAKQTFGSVNEIDLFLQTSTDGLIGARATEPMLFNGVRYCLRQYQTKRAKTSNIKLLQKTVTKACNDYVTDIEKEEKIRPAIGAKLVKKGDQIVTHCHSSSVVKIFTTARKQGKKFHIYNTETRPLYQGRKTSTDLINAGVPDTMIIDDAAAFFVDNKYESYVNIDKVFIGSDAIDPDGNIYNKIGSFSIAMSAWHSGIPVYIVGSLMKVDTMHKVNIEVRDGKEVWPKAPKGLEIINYAFDMVPAKFITGIITEYGIIKPKDIKKYVKKYYPWMMK